MKRTLMLKTRYRVVEYVMNDGVRMACHEPCSLTARVLWLALLTLALSGCGGPRVLREANALEESDPVALTSDSRLEASIERVIVRNGTGSWAADANWDEYHVRVRSLAEGELMVTGITVFDALENRIESSADRARLADATDEVRKRYEQELARPEAERDHRLIGGVAGSVAAGGAAGVAVFGTGGFAGAATAAAAATAVVAGGAFLIGAGVLKATRNFHVSEELAKRQSALPFTIGNDPARVVVFFPIVPRPSALEISYRRGDEERRLRMDTRAPLSRAHEY